MTGGRARVLRPDADRRYAGSSRAAWCTTRCPARRRCTSTCCRGASQSLRLPHRGRHQGHEVHRQPGGERRRVRIRRSRTSCRAARSLNVQYLQRGPQPHVAPGRRRHQRPHQRHQRRRAQLQAQLARVRGRRDAGAVAQRHRAVEPHLLHGATATTPIPYKPLDTRPTRSRNVGVAHPLQPAIRRRRRARCSSATGFSSTRSAAPRTRSTSRGRRRCRGAGISVTPGPALLHADGRRLLHEPAVSARLRRTGQTTAPTRASRRSAPSRAGMTVAQAPLWDGWNVVIARRLLPPGSRLADLRHRQPGHPDLRRALVPGGPHQELLTRGIVTQTLSRDVPYFERLRSSLSRHGGGARDPARGR